MGGRGASSGVSVKGKAYGTEYTTLFQDGNIKFVQPTSGNSKAPMETMTRGRVYVTVNKRNEPAYITYYDNANKRAKQIDLLKPHDNVSPHTHHGYKHNESDTAKGYAHLTAEEKKMVARVKRIWYTKRSKM